MNKLEALYSTWSQKRVGIAKNEFIELLKESPIIDHWGRLQKDAVGGKEEVLEVKDEEADDDDDAIDLRNMAKQIDLKAIHAVLKVSSFLSLSCPTLLTHLFLSSQSMINVI